MKLTLLPLNLSTWVQSLGSMWQKARIDSYLCLTAKIILAASCSCPKLSPLFLFLPTLLLLFPCIFLSCRTQSGSVCRVPVPQPPERQGCREPASLSLCSLSLALNLSFPQLFTSPAPLLSVLPSADLSYCF